jgi:hypothetical protein
VANKNKRQRSFCCGHSTSGEMQTFSISKVRHRGAQDNLRSRKSGAQVRAPFGKTTVEKLLIFLEIYFKKSKHR